MKLNSRVEDEIDPIVALSCVMTVIGKGRISKNCTQYCYVTAFHNRIVVYASKTRTGNDTFIVRRSTNGCEQ